MQAMVTINPIATVFAKHVL